MTTPTQVKSYVTDLNDVGTAFTTTSNPLKTYIDAIAGGGLGANQYLTVVTTGGQTVFTTTPVNANTALVLVGSSVQPPSAYNIDSPTQITFYTAFPAGVDVTFLEHKLASPVPIPGGSAGQILTKNSSTGGDYTWHDPAALTGSANTYGTTLALAHYTGCTGTPTEAFDLFSNISISKTGTGAFSFSLTGITFPTADGYAIHVVAGGTAGRTVVEVEASRTTTGFAIQVYNASGSAADPDTLNVVVSGNPSLAPTNVISAPVGVITWFAMPTPPPGYLFANGAAVSRTTYAALFQQIGTVFGVGDGSTTFNLPDLRGKFVRGWSGGTGTIDSSRTFGSNQDSYHNIPLDQNYALPGGYTADTGPVTQGYLAGPYEGADGHAVTWTYNYANGRDVNGSGLYATGRDTRPVNVAMLPCIKAIPDLYSYAATQLAESFVVTTPTNTFTTTNIDTRYCYVFVDGAYQPPSTYSVPSNNTIVLSTTVSRESKVDLVKIYVASTPSATKDNMVAAVSSSVMVTPALVQYSPYAIKAWGRVSGTSSTPVVGGAGGFTVTRISAGIYSVTLNTAFSNIEYAVNVTVENGASHTVTVVCPSTYNRTPGGFYVNMKTSAGVDIDSDFSIMVSGVQ